MSDAPGSQDTPSVPQTTIHATAVLLGRRAVLIRGPSGSGKSTLALDLLAAQQARGGFGRLIGDDRVAIRACNGRLVARAAAAIAGRIEVRGQGILNIAHEPAGVVGWIVDLASEIPSRHPEYCDRLISLQGIELPYLKLGPQGTRRSATLILNTFIFLD